MFRTLYLKVTNRIKSQSLGDKFSSQGDRRHLGLCHPVVVLEDALGPHCRKCDVVHLFYSSVLLVMTAFSQEGAS